MPRSSSSYQINTSLHSCTPLAAFLLVHSIFLVGIYSRLVYSATCGSSSHRRQSLAVRNFLLATLNLGHPSSSSLLLGRSRPRPSPRCPFATPLPAAPALPPHTTRTCTPNDKIRTWASSVLTRSDPKRRRPSAFEAPGATILASTR